MRQDLPLPSRRRFLQTAGFTAMAAALGRRPAAAAGAQPPALRIRAVDAYPIYINQRSDGLLDAPTFSSDDDPRRWRWGGPFEQLPSAIIAIIKTDQGVTGFGMGAGGSAAVEIIDGHPEAPADGRQPPQRRAALDQMYQSAIFYGRRGLFAMALSAVDNALWDIAGKHAGQPVHALLGGAPRDRIALYQTGGDVAAGAAAGVRNFKRSLPGEPRHPAGGPRPGGRLGARSPRRPGTGRQPDDRLRLAQRHRGLGGGPAERLRPARAVLHGGAALARRRLRLRRAGAPHRRRRPGLDPGGVRRARVHRARVRGAGADRVGRKSSSRTSRGAAAPPRGGASRGSSRRRGSRSSPTAAAARGGSPSR